MIGNGQGKMCFEFTKIQCTAGNVRSNYLCSMWTADVALILFSFRCLISWSISTVRYKSNCCMNIKLNPLTVIEIVMIAIMKKYANDAITKGTQVLSGKANTK